jgi:hypothetical protein
VRRSRAKTPVERFVRAATPFHLYRCRNCRHRGWHFGPVLDDGQERVEARPPGRPVEPRDVAASRRKRRKIVGSVLLGVALGAAAGAYLHSCQQRSEVQRAE